MSSRRYPLHWLLVPLLLAAPFRIVGEVKPSLEYSAEQGARWQSARASVAVAQAGGQPGPWFRFGDAPPVAMDGTRIEQRTDRSMVLVGQVTAPQGKSLRVHRYLRAISGPDGEGLSESMEISGGKGVKADLEIVRPFAVRAELAPNAASFALPLKSGEFQRGALETKNCVAEYKLGRWLNRLARFWEGEVKQGLAITYVVWCHRRVKGVPDGIVEDSTTDMAVTFKTRTSDCSVFCQGVTGRGASLSV